QMKCGIMDQFSVALGKADHAILLDCATLEYDYIPLYLGDYSLLILDSKKPRSLIHSKYNERRAESEEAYRIISTTQSIKNLCGADFSMLELIKDETVYRRARHVITEQLRVKESVKALQFNDLSTFGRLMNASHASMKNDYEITGLEMDTLAETAQQIKGCLGARMTGGGFAGCAIALVHKTAIEEFTKQVSQKYFEVTGRQCEIYNSQIGDGVRQVG
ncbi:MAG TPA: hypothetical protein VG603_04220, partial [Chitinophagales bacterium]|nr:hypothetical protein [Chitinophagales bacterium]